VNWGDVVTGLLQLVGGSSWSGAGDPDHEQHPARVVAALRFPGRAGRSVWRDGYLSVSSPTGVVWRRHRFPLGRRLSMPGLRIGRDRAVAPSEPWWLLTGARVFPATSQGRDFEIAVHPGSVSAVRAWAGRCENGVAPREGSG
jgi:hypothetical protein